MINIIFVGIVFCGLSLGFKAFGEWRAAAEKAVVLDGRIKGLDVKEQECGRFRGATPMALEEAYISFVDDMADIARSYGLGLSIEGGKPLFGLSSLDGLKEARIKAVFSHVPRRGSLVSLLLVLDVRALSAPFLVEEMTHQKDGLVLEAVLFGI